MALRIDDRATGLREIDRFENGVGWLAHPDETMRRASHALEIDSEVWLVDPVDAEGLDELLAEFGDVRGVVVCFAQHTRDAARIADRHNVPVYLPDWFDGVAEELPEETPVARFGAELSDTGLEAHVVKKGRVWKEVALYDPDRGTLLVPESVGASEYFLAGDERLGVHPARRAFPPREALDAFASDPDVDVERVLVGHGSGVQTDARAALRDALEGSRSRMPRLYAKSLRMFLPF
ncbi:hypothetical protein OB955_09600 [Halobacteria archaeon AArc-m2/3/4]|uniref:Uncharacterized protein n=1 Tax=Natronoglomus mannanivorans TaxID=2979990 RepID=A0AAP2Z2Z9_9EURY|nr:hypothetical protein [Halobacteria archaeon AArc-xg1-1]MCU4972995.1 hypothetical protein [Halobacteria archaeon AArc-m2/3/4]